MTSSRLALSLIDLVEVLFYTLELAKSEIVRSYVCYLSYSEDRRTRKRVWGLF